MINDLIEEARSYLGVPWKHQGRTRKGVDCVGFIVLSVRKFGIKVKDSIGYSRNPEGVGLQKLLEKQDCLYEVKDSIIPGDILLFRIRRLPQHVALAVPSTTADIGMIHAYSGGTKKVIEHDLADYWKNKIVAVYRLK